MYLCKNISVWLLNAGLTLAMQSLQKRWWGDKYVCYGPRMLPGSWAVSEITIEKMGSMRYVSSDMQLCT